jgi:hypothetical protein
MPFQANPMSLIQSLGPDFPALVAFFGVLLLSVVTAVIALLADY